VLVDEADQVNRHNDHKGNNEQAEQTEIATEKKLPGHSFPFLVLN
jgi:hypothetical protein